ncbi:hypothetical protein GY21_00815 [Cryobacterium roopkundense]|uniref:Type II secretory pathway pseudopilin PulG n=1 Tax=Cryobacterium roopkundense TaxID=1001240 RepID=A0A099JV81_9MICO|nr:hypothetical protein [Cryobacterium roopkundense]KGJ82344.1 hypothetical protein GY21_00815 [Cryobacterium roopkundense]MBB5639506.1 type II secretory pathway pseudopilin PulG [Cryobacterium roopkundense]
MLTRRHKESEHGYTLVELIVYSSLLIVVVSVVAGLFISGLTTTNRVQAMTAATTSGQVVVDSVETNVRNASGFRLTTPSGSDQLLVARTAKRDEALSWQCVAWYYSAAGNGSIRFKQSPWEILTPTPAELLTWTLVQRGIKPVPGTPIFSSTGQQVTMKFNSLVGVHPPVMISSSATSRAGAPGSPIC